MVFSVLLKQEAVGLTGLTEESVTNISRSWACYWVTERVSNYFFFGYHNALDFSTLNQFRYICT